MQNNYEVFDPFRPQQQIQFRPQKKDDIFSKIKNKLGNSNKTMIAFGIVIIFSGVMVGMGLRIKSMNASSGNNLPSGEVQGALTEATPTSTISPTDTPYPTADPNQVAETPVVVDSSSEGYTPTDAPTVVPTSTASPTPSASPTPTPVQANYNATISSVNSNGNLTATIIVNVTNNGSADGGENPVGLVSSPSGINFSGSGTADGSDGTKGDAVFTVTVPSAGNYTITPTVYNVPYGTGTSVTFTQ